MDETEGRRLAPISELQSDAWAAWNASYHETQPEAYQSLGNALYQLDWHERIVAQLALLDEQNAKLDVLLACPMTRQSA